MSNNDYNQFTYFMKTVLKGGQTLYDFKDKERNVGLNNLYMLDRTQSMFEYENLPDSVPQRNLELALQTAGFLVGIPTPDGATITYGAFTEEPNQWYEPTKIRVTNPYLPDSCNREYTIDKDCVLINNDSMRLGLLPIFTKYGSLLAENELTLQIAIIQERLISLIVANDEKQYQSATSFIKKLMGGELSVLLAQRDKQDKFFENNELGITTQPYATSTSINSVKNLIELEQYLKSSQWNEIGIDSNFNMKREALNSNETGLNKYSLLPFIDNMYNERVKGIDKFNEMFGTDIKVSKSSTWADIEEESELEQEALEKEVESNDESNDDATEPTENNDETKESEENENDA